MPLIRSAILGAVAAGALLCAASAPAGAFPLAAPGIADSHAAVTQVWWDRYGEWHPGRRFGPPPPRFEDDDPPPPPEEAFDGPPPPPPPGFGWRRHHRCHITPWGERVCRW